MLRYLALMVLFVLIGCSPSETPLTSFYYWKTTFKLSPEEKSALTTNHVKRLYIRYCDIVMKGGVPVPESPIAFAEKPFGVTVVPVVYIKNDVMLQSKLDVADLASKVVSFVEQINRKHNLAVAELQIDCDWTDKSKSNYFRFLESVQKKTNANVSCTIRLHQIKYPERTGIPPVKSGVLMYYNMGRIAADESNSIYERTTAIRYLERLGEYPLRLAVALPVFSWGIHIRNGRVIGLLRDGEADTFQSDSSFAKVSDRIFEAKAQRIKNGQFFKQGDLVKIESIDMAAFNEMATDIKRRLKYKPHEIIFYDLDHFNLERYKNEDQFFEEVSANF